MFRILTVFMHCHEAANWCSSLVSLGAWKNSAQGAVLFKENAVKSISTCVCEGTCGRGREHNRWFKWEGYNLSCHELD